MQSSYSIIKSPSVDIKESKDIKTEYINKGIITCEDIESDNVDRAKESFSSMRKSILEKAYIERESIIKESYEKAKNIEKETYEKSYEEGLRNGREDGYKEAYEKNIEKAKLEAKGIIDDAYTLMHNSKIEYENYLSMKQEDILSLAYSITEHILRKNIEREDGINNFIKNILEESRSSKSFVIRCNEKHKSSLCEEIERIKENLVLKSEVFIVEDNSINMGNAIVELENGIVEVGLDKAIESIKKEIF